MSKDTDTDAMLRRLLDRSPLRRTGGDKPVREHDDTHVLIPDTDGQQIVSVNADRVHDGVLQVCRLRIALTVGDECRAVIELNGHGDLDERLFKVEVALGRITVGDTILAVYNEGRYRKKLLDFLTSKSWIEVIDRGGQEL